MMKCDHTDNAKQELFKAFYHFLPEKNQGHMWKLSLCIIAAGFSTTSLVSILWKEGGEEESTHLTEFWLLSCDFKVSEFWPESSDI